MLETVDIVMDKAKFSVCRPEPSTKIKFQLAV